MGWYRIYSNADCWITNKIVSNDSSVRATGSNLGADPSLNVFAFEPAIATGSRDLARTLLNFNVAELSGKIYDEGIIPSSSISYYMKMFNMEHEDLLPSSYELFVYPVSSSWTEGKGIDSDNFRDAGFANWMSASSTATWDVTGSDFITTEGSGSQLFDTGEENLDVDVTDIVVNWLTGSISKNGVVVKLGSTEEDTLNVDYYRKAFHGRESKYVDRLPYIEARWDDVIKDHRHNFAFDQDSNLYVYNFVRGELTALSEPVLVRLQDHLEQASASYVSTITASLVETGIYSASFCIASTASYSASWYDVWHSGAYSYMTGTFQPLELTGSTVDVYDEFVVDVTNLKRVYSHLEEARLLVGVKKQNYITHLGPISSASLGMELECIEKMYYSIENDDTGETIVPFGTGSIPYTQLSYNEDGNYFNLWMNNFVPGFQYRIKFLIDINRYDKKVIDDNFVFKVI